MMASNPVVKVILSSKGQILLPQALLDENQWKPGDKFTFEVVPEGVMVKRFPSVE